MAVRERSRRNVSAGEPGGVGSRATAATVAAIGFAGALVGDATHIASGTTHYDWSGVPTIWRSAIWFPVLSRAGSSRRPSPAGGPGSRQPAGAPASTSSP